jgi:hypothetical protein
MPSVNYGSLPFAEQIQFLRRKVNIPTDSWVDIYGAEHDYGFMVAGANRNAIVADFRSAVEKVIAEGATLADFRKDFDNIVASHGWDYKGGRSWRSRTIYETNLFSSYNAGRFEQLEAAGDALPYRQYHHSGSENPRAEHLAWDGLVLRRDDPWWQTHTPINAWGCQCSVSGLTELGLAELGLTVPDTAPALELETRIIGQRSVNGPREVVVPKGVDPGFEHTPGRSRLEGAIPPERPMPPITGATGGPGLPNTRPTDPLPAPRSLPADTLLPDNLSDEDYAQAFLQPFGATLEQPVVHIDVIGEALVLGRGLFVDRATGAINASSNGPLLPLLAEALLDPDEIWVRMEFADNKTVVRRRYIARFLLPGQDTPALAVFDSAADGWSGITRLAAENDIDDLRMGVRLYRRP